VGCYRETVPKHQDWQDVKAKGVRNHRHNPKSMDVYVILTYLPISFVVRTPKAGNKFTLANNICEHLPIAFWQ